MQVSTSKSATSFPMSAVSLRLKGRSVPHLGRKFYHLAMGLICFSLYAFVVTKTEAVILLSTIGGLLVGFDLIRLRYAGVNRFALSVYGSLMRKEEKHSMSANSYYVLGLLFVVIFFPKNVVLLSVLYLAVGDPVASMVGIRFGKTRLVGRKSLEGSMANFMASSLVTFLAASHIFNLSFEHSLLLAWIGGFISVASELFPAPVDDNFSIPVISAVLLTFTFLIFPLV